MTDRHPPADDHLPLREVFPGVWFASSRVSFPVPLGLRITFSRNMVGLLEPGGWTLLGPVRLSEQAEKEMLARGPIRHAVRLGAFHGQDDAYYVDRFKPRFWAVPGPQKYSEPRITDEIREGGPFPVPGARVVVFRNARQAECAVNLPQHRLLVTSDSVQHYEKDDPLISKLGKILMIPLGFFTPCVIGPIWLKQVGPRDGSLRPDFERVLALDFDNLISAHGSPKLGGAKAALAKNVAKLP